MRLTTLRRHSLPTTQKTTIGGDRGPRDEGRGNNRADLAAGPGLLRISHYSECTGGGGAGPVFPSYVQKVHYL